MIRLIAAVIAGYIVMGALVIAGEIVLEGSNFLMVNLLLAFPYGFGGGWLAAKIAKDREINAGLLLALVAAIMAVVSYQISPALLPVWYWTALSASLIAGAVYGAFRKFLSVQRSAPRKKKKVTR
jgi:hypothetical protein